MGIIHLVIIKNSIIMRGILLFPVPNNTFRGTIFFSGCQPVQIKHLRIIRQHLRQCPIRQCFMLAKAGMNLSVVEFSL